MHANLLDILQCPYCGSSFTLEAGPWLRRTDDEITTGYLCCQCASYPVVDGIPMPLAGYGSDAAFRQMLAEAPEQALCTMLELDEERQATFKEYLAQGDAVTYSEWVEVFSPGNEGPYFVHRFANPTYLIGQTILRAVGSDPRCFTRRAIDLAGGSGHLTRALCEIAASHADGTEVFLAETNFWKLWIARRITAPACIPICCDAEVPLPFKQGSFSLALCSDAYHYIWSKRQFAAELMRLVGADGVIVINHVHNALQENHSVGLPLAPQWWRNLLAEHGARACRESEVLESVIEKRPVDLARVDTDAELNNEAALFLIASKLDGIFRQYAFPGAQFNAGVWKLNPLYQKEGDGWRLCFPSDSYEDEYQACKRYLPAQLEFSDAELAQLAAGEWNDRFSELAERYVLLNVPQGYI